MTAPVINTVVKNAPDLSTNWVEGADWGWVNGGVQTNSTSFVDMTGSTSKSNTTGQNNLIAAESYYNTFSSLDNAHPSYTSYSNLLEDGVVVSSWSNTGTTKNYSPWSRYGGKSTYSIQDNDFGAVVTLGVAVAVVKFQCRTNNASYWCNNQNTISWFLKSKADTILPDRINCVAESSVGQNSGRMYVDSFTFICHGSGSLSSSGLTRYNNNTTYFPTHQVKNIIGSLDYTTGGIANITGDYAIFIEGVFLVMT